MSLSAAGSLVAGNTVSLKSIKHMDIPMKNETSAAAGVAGGQFLLASGNASYKCKLYFAQLLSVAHCRRYLLKSQPRWMHSLLPMSCQPPDLPMTYSKDLWCQYTKYPTSNSCINWSNDSNRQYLPLFGQSNKIVQRSKLGRQVAWVTVCSSCLDFTDHRWKNSKHGRKFLKLNVGPCTATRQHFLR